MTGDLDRADDQLVAPAVVGRLEGLQRRVARDG
jgi:hypothetical protein